MDIEPEGNSFYQTVTFTDDTGALAVPQTIEYSTYCVTTKTAIKTNVSVTPASTVKFHLDALDNAIQNAANEYELKVLTVRADYGTNDEANKSYEWSVKNLYGVP